MSRNNGDKARYGKDRKQRIKSRTKIRELRKTVTASADRTGSAADEGSTKTGKAS